MDGYVKNNYIKSKKGAAMEWALVFGLVIFALLAVLMTFISGVKSTETYAEKTSRKQMDLEQIGEYFIRAVGNSGYFPSGDEETIDDFVSDEERTAFAWMDNETKEFFLHCKEQYGYTYKVDVMTDEEGGFLTFYRPEGCTTRLNVMSGEEKVFTVIVEEDITYTEKHFLFFSKSKNPKTEFRIVEWSINDKYEEEGHNESTSTLMGFLKSIWKWVGSLFNMNEEILSRIAIQYELNGGKSQSCFSSVNPGEKINLPTPWKSGFAFTGWYDSEGKFVGNGGDEFTPTESTIFYAHWEACKVTFEAQFTDKIKGTMEFDNDQDGKVELISDDNGWITLPKITLEESSKYDWLGWYTEDFSKMIGSTGNFSPKETGVTYVAKYEKSYNAIVYFESDDSYTINSEITFVKYKKDPVNLPSVYKKGFNFLGWKIKGSDDSGVFKDKFKPAEGVEVITLVPVFEGIKVTIMSDEQEVCTVSYSDSFALDIKKAILEDCTYTKKEGYHVNKEKYYLDLDSILATDGTPKQDGKIYINWIGNTITFDANGDRVTIKGDNPITYEGKPITLPKAEKVGSRFEGWYTEPIGGEKVGVAGDTYIPQSDAVTLYAQWFEFTVTYDLNLPVQIKGAFSAQFDTKGPSATKGYVLLPGDTSQWLIYETFDGHKNVKYIFSCWSTVKNSTNSADYISVGAEFAPTKDVTIYGVWVEAYKYILTFHGNGGSLVTKLENGCIKILPDEDPTVTLPVAERPGYRFLGWSLTENGKVISNTYTASAHTVFYAKWERVKVTLNLNGGDAGSSAWSYSPIDNSLDVIITNPTRSGYVFKGWTKTKVADNSSNVELVSTDGTYNLSEMTDVILYAYWEGIKVTFVANGGNLTQDSFVVQYPFTNVTSLVTASRTYYRFVGWYTSNGDLVVDQSNAVSQLTKYVSAVNNKDNIYVYANWDEYVVTLIYENGYKATISKEATALPGDILSKKGYKFSWYNASTGKEYQVGDIIKPEREMTLEAKYVGYTVNVNIFYTDNSKTETKQYTYGTTEYANAVKTIPGCKSVKWYKTKTERNKQVSFSNAITYISSYYPTSDGENIYAKCERYKISFDVSGTVKKNYFGIITRDVNVNIGDTVSNLYGSSTLPNCNVKSDYKDRYVFSGWIYDGKIYKPGTVFNPTSDITLKAKWRVAGEYIVEFDANGGTCDVSAITVTDSSGTFGTLPTPTLAGYSFAGWYTSAKGGDLVTSSTKVNLDDDIVLYAHWSLNSFQVTLNKNAADASSISCPACIYVAYGSKYEGLPDTLSRTGYTFLGWFTSPDGGTKVTSSTIVNLSSDQTLYARWRGITYTVTLITNDGALPTGVSNVFSVIYGEKYSSLKSPTKKGYTFLGWYKEESFTNQVTVNTIVSTNADHKLYAKWEKSKYTITFDANGGTCGTSSKSVTHGDKYGTLPNATKTGNTFDGWWTAKEGGTYIKEDDIVAISANTTFYAHWNPFKYTVKVKPNGGKYNNSTNEVDVEVSYGSTYLSQVGTPTRAGYNFDGWYLDNTTKLTSTSTVNISDNSHTLVARWTGYTIVYDASTNGGKIGSSSSTTKVYSGSGLPSVSNPTIAGGVFKGWYTDSACTNKITASSYVPSKNNVTVYAGYTKYVITLDVNGGDALSPNSYECSCSLPEPTRTGYSFAGWYTAASGGTRVGGKGDTYTAPGANKTLYAQWTQMTYSLTLKGKQVTIKINGTQKIDATSTNKTSTINGLHYNDVVKIEITYKKDSNSFSPSPSITLYSNSNLTGAASGDSNGTYYFAMPASNLTLYCESSESSCVSSDTLITMADGTFKKACELTELDKIMSFNHETGKLESTDVLVIFKSEEKIFDKCGLYFDNGKSLEIINEHGLFDYTIKQYVIINNDNAEGFIGHEFAYLNEETGCIEKTVLVSHEVITELDTSYSIVTARNINCFANGLLNVSDRLEGTYGFFEYDDDLKYNEEDMNEKIELYGISPYEEWSEYFTYEQYKAFCLDYANIAVGMGLTTKEQHIQTFIEYFDSVVR